MKTAISVLFILACIHLSAQPSEKIKNIFIITTDGFRWQELFTGADSTLINNPALVKDTTLIKTQYWDPSADVRKRKLLPFFWNTIAEKGQLFGNRLYENKVNVSNIYKISYPGYNEILTGYADNRFIPNISVKNRNTNILEYLNEQEGYEGKVVAFTSWNVFPFILNEKRSGFPINSGYEMLNEKEDSGNTVINEVQENVVEKKHTRYDMLTYLSAKGYIEQNHPKVVFLGFGETDESAHQAKYDMYLQKAHQFDEMVSQLWYYVQTDPFYKDNTVFLITTDHGRGSKPSTWKSHGFWIKGSGEVWLAMLGGGIAPASETKGPQQLYQKQIASTIAMLLGEDFKAEHPIGKPMNVAFNKVEEISTTVSVATPKLVLPVLYSRENKNIPDSTITVRPR